MKLLWFHLMPYTDLPDDFKETHPSVWVDIDPGLFDGAKAHHMYNDFMDELEFAAEIGFDGICVNEHHQNAYGLMPSPNLIASTLARRTHRPQCHGHCAGWPSWKSTGMQPSSSASTMPLRVTVSPPGCRQNVLFQ